MEMERRQQEIRNRREQERRRAQTRSAKKKKSKMKMNKGCGVIMLGVVVIGTLILCAYSFLFPVKTIVVEGNGRYTAEEIIAASGIEVGDNLLALDMEEIEENIRLSCPYIHSVSLEKKLPSGALLTVTEGAPVLSFAMNNQYYLVNNRYELMEINEQPMGGAIVHGLTVTAGDVGSVVSMEPKEAETVLKAMVTALEQQGVTQITQIDLRDLNNIRLLFADRHIWEVGNTEKLEYKLKFGAEISSRETGTGRVNLKELNKGKNGYFTQCVIGEFVPVDPVTPTNIPEVE